jgi:uncharacterized protein YciI
MLAIVIISYEVSMEVVAEHTGDHRAYLKSLYEQGKLIASGPFAPRTGGALLLRVEREDEIAKIIAGDPFHTRGVARHDARVWVPTLGGERLEGLAVVE